MIKKPVIGISGCLAGSAVRFDGGHKRADFLMDKLVEWVTFRPVCPEMAIGLPVPRPALRLVRSTQGNIRMCFSGFAPIFPDICYHLTHYKPAAADIPVASDNPAHYADAIRYNARTPLQGSLLPLTRLVWA